MVEPITIASLTLGIITAISSLLIGLHIRKCYSLCCTSHCDGHTPITDVKTEA